ncbi:hypothetical protein AVEN_256884-1 [Araneus ventricosus]|uniref:Uncharacterized protein n=1 Tax=Araneus ventricosus TaxID=182803 RepID=A0A4Y2CHH0_ARAVE|nr:hypothetical protein AVEN_256884-1 [Araneus ventricosus]
MFKGQGSDPQARKLGAYELQSGDVKKHKMAYELLLQRQEEKAFFTWYCDEKWIRCDNPKHKKSWFRPDEPSTTKLNIHGVKLMLYLVGLAGCGILWATPIQQNHH